MHASGGTTWRGPRVAAAWGPILAICLACGLGGGGGAWVNPADEATPIAPTPIASGVTFRQDVIDRDGVPMRVWLYAPTSADGPLPLVVIGPAGSNMRSGMALGEGDVPEHLPYVRAGFVVASFDIDGGRSRMWSTASEERAFAQTDFGTANARAALDHALAVEPRIDRGRIYAAGHSSAATLALVLTAREPRVCAVAAYAPVADLVSYFQGYGESLPGAESGSPLHLASSITQPVYLFTADDDDVIDVGAVDRLAAALPANAQSRRRRAAVGGHYESMIHEIPAAIRWMQQVATCGGGQPPSGAKPTDID
jgi:dienelactone hydrolase